jgi:lysophospholipase L1-like esterase
MLRSFQSLLLLLVSGATALASAADAPALKQGDKIVFLGDSITAGASGPTGFITLIKKALDEKHKDWKIETVNAGVSGNEINNLQARVEKDVIAKKPNLVFIYIGINDVWHHPQPDKEKFEAGLKEIIGKMTAINARVILCTPSVIGEKTGGANPKDKHLDELSDVSRKVAKDLSLSVCDLRVAFVDSLKEKNKDNKDKGVLTGDGVHLNAEGNKLVAEQMLKALGQ